MEYSIVGITAIIISVILNFDILFKKHKEKNYYMISYRFFIYITALFFISDIAWGILNSYHLMVLLHIDTTVYFIAMCLSVSLWTRYVTFYVAEKNFFNKIIIYAGTAILLFGLVVIVINYIKPILFYFDENNNYHASYMRYALLTVQLLLFVLTSIYGFIKVGLTKGILRTRFLAISLFGIIMGASITLQTLFPLLPFYAVGCMIGICIIHQFVVNSEKEEAIIREEKQRSELLLAKKLAYTDPLTGAKSKHAYVEIEEELDKKILKKEIKEFAVVVFDINGLKYINDTKGHDAGDEYTINSYKEITSIYKDVPIYRFGGDEFVAILFDDNYKVRDNLFTLFENNIMNNIKNGMAVVSSGMADFDITQDNTYHSVFLKADKRMYARKEYLKQERQKAIN